MVDSGQLMVGLMVGWLMIVDSGYESKVVD